MLQDTSQATPDIRDHVQVVDDELDDSGEPPNENNKGTNSNYTLQSVVCHLGHCASAGHFVVDLADGHSSAGGKLWTRFDDSAVRRLPEDNHLLEKTQQEGYLYFYVWDGSC